MKTPARRVGMIANKPLRGVNIRCPYCKAEPGQPCHSINSKLPVSPMHKARETAFMAKTANMLLKYK